MNANKIKIFLFIILIIFLILLFIFSIFGMSISLLSVENIKSSRKEKNNLINDLKINGVNAVYDENSNIYYYSINNQYENKNYILKLELDKGYKYKIIDNSLNIVKVTYDTPIKIIIYNNKYYCEIKLQFTNLPIISINTSDEITVNDTRTEFEYINTNTKNVTISNNAMIHIRGASSLSFDKKSYKVEMYNKDFSKEKNVTISNFYQGSDFILDAVYRDPSKIRNLLSIQLWNSISEDFSEVKVNSEFVELFINDEYKGLYLFTEPINRKKLNLKKSNSNDTSIIIKTNGWYMVDDNSNFKNITDQSYLFYEIKYPNDNELFPKVWDKFMNMIYSYYSSDEQNTFEIISNTWNLKNYIDVIIFNAFIDNTDNNLAKNNYFYMNSLNSKELYIQPWDMEYSFGLEYSFNPNENFASKNYDNYKNIKTLFKHEYSDEINQLLIDRYWNLRKNIITEDYFDNLLDCYLNELSKGSAKRDAKIWYEYDVEKEIEEIRYWIYQRINVFDKYVSDLENE